MQCVGSVGSVMCTVVCWHQQYISYLLFTCFEREGSFPQVLGLGGLAG